LLEKGLDFFFDNFQTVWLNFINIKLRNSGRVIIQLIIIIIIDIFNVAKSRQHIA